MSRKKIAFVVVRYGMEINGGAEFHCRMLAERLAADYDVEVLTTCVKNYLKAANEYEAGEDVLNGVTVRRFPVSPADDGCSETYYIHRSRFARRLRKNLAKAGILRWLSYIFPVWNLGYEADVKALEHSVFYSPSLREYIRANKDRYEAIIAVTAEYAPFFFAALDAGEKLIAIPTLHDTRVSYRSFMTHSFRNIRYTGFNTESEWRLAKSILGKCLGQSGIISVGIESPEPADWGAVKEKFGLPEKYICYVGRIEKGKTGDLLDYLGSYTRKHPERALPLVMVGQVFEEPDNSGNARVIPTGFVTDEEKRAIMMHSCLLVNPSKYESLSLIVLEALNDRVPVLVNGRCEVLKEHCVRSKGAVKCYTDEKSFCDTIDIILSDPEVRASMAGQGYDYYRRNYTWEKIMPRLYKAIGIVSGTAE